MDAEIGKIRLSVTQHLAQVKSRCRSNQPLNFASLCLQQHSFPKLLQLLTAASLLLGTDIHELRA